MKLCNCVLYFLLEILKIIVKANLCPMCESQTSSITIPWELVEMQTLRPSLDLLSHNLRFTQIPRRFVNAFKFEIATLYGWTIE